MSTMDMGGPPEDEFGEDEDVEFEIVEDRGTSATLECPACGFVFDVDAHTSLNLEWRRSTKEMIAVCPICKRKQR